MPDFEFDETTDLVMRFEKMMAEDREEFFDTEELEIIIDYYFASEEFRKALAVADYGIRIYPGMPDFYIRKAQLYLDQSRIDESRKMLKEAQKIAPENPDVLYLQADIHSKTRNHHLAIQYLKKLVSLYPEDTDALSFLAAELMEIKNYYTAIEILKNLLEENPEDPFLLHNLITCFEETHKTDEAIELLTKVIDLSPYNEVAWHNLGNLYLKKGNFEKAIWAYEYAILIDENYIAPYYDLGYTYEITGNYQKAIDIYNEALGIDIFTSHSYMCLGRCYEALHQFKKALFYLEKAYEEDRTNPDILASLVRLYDLTGKDENVLIDYITRLLELDTDFSGTLLAARILFKRGYYQDGMELATDLLENHQIDKEIILYYIKVLVTQGEVKSALRILKVAVELYRDDLHLRIILASLYTLQGNFYTATTHIKKINKIRTFDSEDLIHIFSRYMETDDMSEWIEYVNYQL